MGKQPGSLLEEHASKRNGPLNFPRDDRHPGRGQALTERGTRHFVPSSHRLPLAHAVGRVSGERLEQLLIFPPLLPMRVLEKRQKKKPTLAEDAGVRGARGASHTFCLQLRLSRVRRWHGPGQEVRACGQHEAWQRASPSPARAHASSRAVCFPSKIQDLIKV